jgi:hypothetical protein
MLEFKHWVQYFKRIASICGWIQARDSALEAIRTYPDEVWSIVNAFKWTVTQSGPFTVESEQPQGTIQ